MNYKKSQIGWVPLAIIALPGFYLIFSYLYRWENHPLSSVSFLVVATLFVIVCLLFYKLTVELDGPWLKLNYGIGMIRIKYRIDELVRAEIIKTPWYYGLGIRITPYGMLYNIQGAKAVRIDYLLDGKKKTVMVGSPEPEELKAVLEGNLGRQG